jgi:hypothetical protein
MELQSAQGQNPIAYGSGRVGRIADLVQIGSKVRRRRRADITIAVAEVAAGWFVDFWPNGESADTLRIDVPGA